MALACRRADPALRGDRRPGARSACPTASPCATSANTPCRSLARPERVCQLIAPGLPDDFPPLSSPAARPNNLPCRADPLHRARARAARSERSAGRLPAPDPHRAGRHGQDAAGAASGRGTARRLSPTARGWWNWPRWPTPRCWSRPSAATLRVIGAAGPVAGCGGAGLSAPQAPAADPRQLRAPDRRVRAAGRRAAPRRAGPHHPGDQPRDAGRGAARRPIASLRWPCRKPGSLPWMSLRRSEAVQLFVARAAAVQPGFALHGGERDRHRGDLPAARRHPAGHRAGGRADARPGRDRHRRAPRRPLSPAHRRQSRRPAAPADAARPGGLELGSALRRGTETAPQALRLRGRLDAGGCGSGVRRPTRRSGQPGRH